MNTVDGRKPGVYTLLVAGVDVVSNNTDTIMIGRLDTVNHTLNVVSIPVIRSRTFSMRSRRQTPHIIMPRIIPAYRAAHITAATRSKDARGAYQVLPRL